MLTGCCVCLGLLATDTLDVVGYESLLLGHFSILQCKNVEDHTCPGPSASHEYNSVFVGMYVSFACVCLFE